KVDPIAEAPKKIWYFRNKNIGERGPLKAKAMRHHLKKGDVDIGCVVWREDWEDWLPAEDVFPELVQKLHERKKKERLNRAFKNADYQIPEELNPDSETHVRHKRRTAIFAICIALGLLVIFGLTVLLIRILEA
ncbi:MAG: DUF4339 domain-containing protein, partial [Planctomycetota bacterium]